MSESDELKELLTNWRAFKRTAIGVAIRIGLAALLIGLAFKIGYNHP